MKQINKAVVKKDAYALLSGKPLFTDDLAMKDCLIIRDPALAPCVCQDLCPSIPPWQKRFREWKLSLLMKMFLLPASPWLAKPIPNLLLMIERS